VRSGGTGLAANAAVTVAAPVAPPLGMMHGLVVPLHPPPDHPVNVEPASGVAVRYTGTFVGKCC
jgi:hypothetical protein